MHDLDWCHIMSICNSALYVSEVIALSCTHARAYLRHDAVSARALLVLKDDIRVVVDDQVLEARVVAIDASLGRAARTERRLRDVGHVLLVDEWRHLARALASEAAASRAAAERRVA